MHYSPDLLLYAYFKYLIIAWLIIGASSVKEQTREDCSIQLFTDCHWKRLATTVCQSASDVCSHCSTQQQLKLWESGKTHPGSNPTPLIFKCRGQTSPPGVSGKKSHQSVIYWGQWTPQFHSSLPALPSAPPPWPQHNRPKTLFGCILHWTYTELHLNWIPKKPRRLVAKTYFWGCVIEEEPESMAAWWNGAVRGF